MTGFDWGVIVRALPFLWDGMKVSLMLTGAGVLGGVLLGTVLAIMRLSPYRALSVAAAAYVTTFRSLPLILILFWFYFLVPLALGRPVGAFASAVIAFILSGPPFSEGIIGPGFSSVPRGQLLAAKQSGLTTSKP